jgi:glutathione-regulated potassium-efflux system ancillary protein KefC
MENNILLAIFVLLAASVALVPLAKAAGLGTVLGYLAAGILIGPFGLGLVSDSDLIHQVADFGIVMMLFLIGLDLQPSELWRMRHKVLGLGVTQMAATSAIIGLALYLSGFPGNVSVIVGLALAMSSTAIAMQSAQQRDITRTDAGRASLAILLVQDVAVIPILAAVPILALAASRPLDVEVTEAVEAIANPADWITPLIIVGAFVSAIVIGRFLVRPLLSYVARTGVREAFTALGRPWSSGPRCSRNRRGSHRPWAPSSVASCWPTANTGTSLRAISNRSRACCSVCSSSPWACR